MDDTAQTNPTETQPQQQSENYKPQSLKKIFLQGFFLGIILVVFVGIISFFLLNKENKQATSVVPKPTPTKPKTNNNAWKTYADNKVQFSLSYPKDWYIEKTPKFTSVPKGYSSWITILIDPSTFTDPDTITLCSESQDVSKPCLQDGKNNKAVEEITVNGNQAKSFYLGGQGDLALHVVQIEGPNGQQVELSTTVFVEGTDTLFSKILSTFKFINAQKLTMEGNFIWNVPANTVSPEMEKELKTAFASYIPPKNYQNLGKGISLSVEGISTSTESAYFAIADITERDAKNAIIPTDGMAFYLQKDNGKWEIFANGEANFCQVLKGFPDDLMDVSSYHNYYGCP